MSTAAEYAQGLRELADWIEVHPEIERPGETLNVYAMNTKEEAAVCLRALKPCRKEYIGEMFYLSRNFGPIKLTFTFLRDQVCTKKVVGTKSVGTRVIPARLIPEEIIEAHEEEIVEWECGEALTPIAEAETPLA